MAAVFQPIHQVIAGLAKLTLTLLTEGTSNRSSVQISDLLNDLGSEISGYVNLDNSVLTMSCLKSAFAPTLNLYADIMLHPSFPGKEFERRKKEQILEIAQQKASPASLSLRVIPLLMYPADHAYRTDITGLGDNASVQQITREEVSKFYQSWYVPNNAFITVVGDITESELRDKLEKALSVWKQKAIPAINIGEAPVAAATTVYIIDKPGAAQSNITASVIAPSSTDTGDEAVSLMNNILGGTFLSRLNMNLREDKHWSYGAGSFKSQAKGPALFTAIAAVQTDKTKESMQEMLKELTRINSSKPISADEFAKEQNSTILSIPAQWQTNYGIMRFIMSSIVLNRGVSYPGKYPSILQGLTPDDVQKAAGRVVKSRNLTWLIIGDRQKIEAGIRELNFGTVKILDADGNEVKQ